MKTLPPPRVKLARQLEAWLTKDMNTRAVIAILAQDVDDDPRSSISFGGDAEMLFDAVFSAMLRSPELASFICAASDAFREYHERSHSSDVPSPTLH